METLNRFTFNEISESSVIADLRLYHPLFKELNFKSSSIIFHNGSLIQLNDTQVLYKEGAGDCLVYIVLCGRLIVYTQYGDVLSVVRAGECVGEEAFMSSQWNYRKESCVSDGVSYLLAIDSNSMKEIKEQFVIYGYQHNYLVLMRILEDSFRRKQRRRKLLSNYWFEIC